MEGSIYTVVSASWPPEVVERTWLPSLQPLRVLLCLKSHGLKREMKAVRQVAWAGFCMVQPQSAIREETSYFRMDHGWLCQAEKKQNLKNDGPLLPPTLLISSLGMQESSNPIDHCFWRSQIPFASWQVSQQCYLPLLRVLGKGQIQVLTELLSISHL